MYGNGLASVECCVIRSGVDGPDAGGSFRAQQQIHLAVGRGVVDAYASPKKKSIRAGQQPGKTQARIPCILAVAIEPECVLTLGHSGGDSGAVVIGVNNVAVEAARPPADWD